jgi:hypothetical protein
MEQSSEDELELKPKRKVPKHVQIQENVPQESNYDALHYALFLCHGYCMSAKAAQQRDNNPGGTRLLVLDETGWLYIPTPRSFFNDRQ